MPEGQGDRLLTPAEVAELFRVDPKTVSRWSAAGRITSLRTPGGHRRYRQSEIQRVLAEDGETEDRFISQSEAFEREILESDLPEEDKEALLRQWWKIGRELMEQHAVKQADASQSRRRRQG